MKEFIFIVDFTWDPSRKTDPLKILEMGDYFRSSLSGLNYLRGQDNKQEFATTHLATLKQHHPGALYLQDDSFGDIGWRSDAVTVHDFKSEQSAMYNGFDARLLTDVLQTRAELELSSTTKLTPLVVSLKGTRLNQKTRMQIDKLATKLSQLHVLNHMSGVAQDACVDKVVYHVFARGHSFYPVTLLVDFKNTTSAEIVKFIENSAATHYVIKPTNGIKGVGVRVVARDQTLALVEAIKSGKSTDEYWVNPPSLSPDSQFLLLQVCCPSQQMQFGTKTYRPTGRALIRCIFSDDNLLTTMEFLGGYWKLPKAQAFADHTTETIMSSVSNNSRNVAAIHPQDWQEITTHIQKFFTPVILQMCATPLSQLAKHFFTDAKTTQAAANTQAAYQSSNALENYFWNFYNESLDASQRPADIKDEKFNTNSLIMAYTNAVDSFMGRLDYGSPQSLDVLPEFTRALKPMLSVKSVDINVLVQHSFVNTQATENSSAVASKKSHDTQTTDRSCCSCVVM